jgi:Flp pilus assembly pilin Flp
VRHSAPEADFREPPAQERPSMARTIRKIWSNEVGQDIAEYAIILALILVVIIGTVQFVGGNANGVFSHVASDLQQDGDGD